MIQNKFEEKQKDEILQEINDLLEKENWGDGCERLSIKVVFEGHFNLQPLLVNRKEAIKNVKNFWGGA